MQTKQLAEKAYIKAHYPLVYMFQHLHTVFRTDFSVTNRLLSPYNNGGTSSLSHHQPSVTISYHDDGSCSHQPPSQMPSWQSMLPNDQGGVPAKQYLWRNAPDNSGVPQGSAASYNAGTTLSDGDKLSKFCMDFV
jgi:hypothetical protein